MSVVPITFSVQARFEASVGTFQLSFEGNAVSGFKSGYTETKGIECKLQEQPKVLEVRVCACVHVHRARFVHAPTG